MDIKLNVCLETAFFLLVLNYATLLMVFATFFIDRISHELHLPCQ